MGAKELPNNVKNFILFGLSLAIGTTVAISLADKIIALLSTDPIRFYLSIILIIVTLFWLCLWAIFGFKEAKLLQDHIDVKDFEMGSAEYLAYLIPILLGLLFGALFALSIYPQFYIPIVILVLLISGIGDNTTLKLLSKHLFVPTLINNSLDKHQIKIREQIYFYYFQRPYFLRLLIAIIIHFLALIVLLLNIDLQSFTSVHIAYFLTITGILFNELLIWSWRIARSKKIDEIEKDWHKKGNPAT